MVFLPFIFIFSRSSQFQTWIKIENITNVTIQAAMICIHWLGIAFDP